MKKLIGFMMLSLIIISCGKEEESQDINTMIRQIEEEFLPELNTEEEILTEETQSVNGENWLCTTKQVNINKTPAFFPLFDPGSDAIYPGSALQGGSIQTFPPDKIPVSRSGGSVVINNLTGTEVSSVTMDEVSLVNVTNAINKIIRSQSEDFPVDAYIKINQIKSKESLAIDVSANASYFGVFSAKANFNVSKDQNTNNFLVEIYQKFYTISFERPTNPKEFFHPDITSEDLTNFVGDGNPPVYISSVTYGRVFYLLISSTAKDSELAASLSASFFFGGFNGSVKHISEVDGLTIQSYAMGGNKNSIISAMEGGIKGLEEFLEAIKEGNDITQAVPLSFNVRSIKSDQIVRQGLLTSYEVKDCIPYSDKLHFSESTIDFGRFCVNKQERVVKNLRIRNLHSDKINLNIESPESSTLTLSHTGGYILESGKSLNLELTFDPICIKFGCAKLNENLKIIYTLNGEEEDVIIPLNAEPIKGIFTGECRN